MFSGQRLPVKIAMVVAFVAIMAVVAWVVNKSVYEWLPEQLTDFLFVGGMGLAIGYLAGERGLRRRIERHGCDPAELVSENAMDSLFDPGPDGNKYPPGKDPYRVHLVCPCHFARKAQLDDEAELALILDAAENPDRYRHL